MIPTVLGSSPSPKWIVTEPSPFRAAVTLLTLTTPLSFGSK
jgi:hypothetical protein